MKKTTKRPSKKSFPVENGNASPSSHPQPGDGGERTVKKVKLSKALTIPDGTTVTDACRRMAARRVDAVLLTDSSALLSGILTDKDVATRVVAEGLLPDVTTVSKVMTRNPIFVTSDTLAIDALQKMIQGKFRHLPVVENGEVIAILDITKCLYDAIARVEKASQQGGSIAAAAVDGVEHQRAPNNFIDTLRERMFKPSLATILGENTKVAISSASDPVNVAAKRMQDLRVSSSVIVTETKIQGILTSKDILMRVMAPNLSPDTTLVEKVMTPNPQCASLETTIIDALHMMHDGKFLHLPVVDKDGNVVACVDVLQISHAAISLVENSYSGNANNDVAGTIMQKFWDSAFSLEPPEDYDTNSEISGQLTLDGADTTKSTYQSAGFGNSYSFKFEDLNGQVHRFNCGSEHQEELVSAVMQRIGAINDGERPTLMYEDDEGDKIIIATNNDLAAAVSYARSAGLKALKLNLKFGNSPKQTQSNTGTATEQKTSVVSYRTGIFAGAVALAGIGILVYLKRANQ
ncbi:CBS domain-containing protein CBSCBSPB3 [Trifolium repens]|nr:CBS domain-containing protein CBSCBSPB3 [Trifolium repens]